MSWQHTKRGFEPMATAQPRLVTVAIIHDHWASRKVLLARRAREPQTGSWSLIGGCGAFLDSKDPVFFIIINVFNLLQWTIGHCCYS